MKKREIKYDLECVRINPNVAVLFEQVIIKRDGTLIGRDLYTHDKGNKNLYFHINGRSYMLAKVVLHVFNHFAEVKKDITFIDGDYTNCHVDNLRYGRDVHGRVYPVNIEHE